MQPVPATDLPTAHKQTFGLGRSRLWSYLHSARLGLLPRADNGKHGLLECGAAVLRLSEQVSELAT